MRKGSVWGSSASLSAPSAHASELKTSHLCSPALQREAEVCMGQKASCRLRNLGLCLVCYLQKHALQSEPAEAGGWLYDVGLGPAGVVSLHRNVGSPSTATCRRGFTALPSQLATGPVHRASALLSSDWLPSSLPSAGSSAWPCKTGLQGLICSSAILATMSAAACMAEEAKDLRSIGWSFAPAGVMHCTVSPGGFITTSLQLGHSTQAGPPCAC